MGRMQISTLGQRIGAESHIGHTWKPPKLHSDPASSRIELELTCSRVVWKSELLSFRLNFLLGKQTHGSYGSDQLTYSGEQPIKVMLGNYQRLSRIPQNLSLDCIFAMFYSPFRGTQIQLKPVGVIKLCRTNKSVNFSSPCCNLQFTTHVLSTLTYGLAESQNHNHNCPPMHGMDHDRSLTCESGSITFLKNMRSENDVDPPQRKMATTASNGRKCSLFTIGFSFVTNLLDKPIS